MMAIGGMTAQTRGRWVATHPLAVSALVLFVATSVAVLAKPVLGEGYASLIFVVGIMLIGAISGVARAVTTAIVGAAAFNFFVAAPLLQFRFSNASDFAPPLTFLLCAVISGVLSGRLRDQSNVSRRANARLESLLNASRDLQPVRSAEQLRAVLDQHLASIGAFAVALDWFADGQPASERRGMRKEAITDGQTMLGALVYHPGRASAEDIAFVAALARLSSLALTRLRLDIEVADTRALAKSEELKTALLSAVSHDLRTPITTIGTAAASLQSFNALIDETTRAELLARIVEECDRLNHLTENLLQMSRLQAGDGQLSRNVLSAQDMIRRAIARLRSQNVRRTFVIDVPREDTLVMADTALFELALGNVLQNAVKFSGDGSTITATCLARDADCVITITDQGIGVPADEQTRVFERFYRANARTAHRPGSGLGLAIAKGFVEASGGSIALTSPVAEGRGTAITICIPRAQEEPLP